MPGRLEHRVAVITGGGSGIGMESSLLFASEGCLVIVADIDAKAAERTVEKIKQSFSEKCPTPIAVQCDVGKEEDVKALVEKAVQVGKRLDVIFNNAGIMHPDDSDAIQTDEKIWDLTMRVNCKGVWWGCKYGIQAMLQNPTDESKGLKKGGSIINTASFVAKLGAATPQLAYTASKGAVLAMTRELAMVHARDGIRVNALCPGPFVLVSQLTLIVNFFTAKKCLSKQNRPLLMDFLNTPEKRERRVVHLPMGRFDSSYVTGTDFMVDGGAHACYVTPTGEPASAPPLSLAS
ncbi:hypothetical protein H4Q26_016602 [Puccinia striiformis f. sp. tritici PST-130]|nr:hypothetical protein H4Q26_016602 [Puccinia striiformis f. sp. tritici PST-130]